MEPKLAGIFEDTPVLSGWHINGIYTIVTPRKYKNGATHSVYVGESGNVNSRLDTHLMDRKIKPKSSVRKIETPGWSKEDRLLMERQTIQDFLNDPNFYVLNNSPSHLKPLNEEEKEYYLSVLLPSIKGENFLSGEPTPPLVSLN